MSITTLQTACSICFISSTLSLSYRSQNWQRPKKQISSRFPGIWWGANLTSLIWQVPYRNFLVTLGHILVPETSRLLPLLTTSSLKWLQEMITKDWTLCLSPIQISCHGDSTVPNRVLSACGCPGAELPASPSWFSHTPTAISYTGDQQHNFTAFFIRV